MTAQDIVVRLKLRLIVKRTDLPARSIGIVTQVTNDPWRFWLYWPLPGRNRYSLAFEESDLRHFEVIHEAMTEAAFPAGCGRQIEWIPPPP